MSIPMARLIKRYENRKLYDTETSGYVSLKDIARLVREGETVQVVDKATDQDLTAQILTQIILEEQKQGTAILPTDLLHDILRRSEQALDTGVARIRKEVDTWMRASAEKVHQMIQPRANELTQLRSQLSNLDTLLGQLLNEKEADNDAPTKNTMEDHHE